jgi:hypothetical protein
VDEKVAVREDERQRGIFCRTEVHVLNVAARYLFELKDLYQDAIHHTIFCPRDGDGNPLRYFM